MTAELSLALCAAVCYAAVPFCSGLRRAHGSYALERFGPPLPPKLALARGGMVLRKFCGIFQEPYLRLKHAFGWDPRGELFT